MSVVESSALPLELWHKTGGQGDGGGGEGAVVRSAWRPCAPHQGPGGDASQRQHTEYEAVRALRGGALRSWSRRGGMGSSLFGGVDRSIARPAEGRAEAQPTAVLREGGGARRPTCLCPCGGPRTAKDSAYTPPSCVLVVPPRRNAGLWCVSTRRDQHKAQKEMWLVSGLQDHRYLSVNKDVKMPVDGPLKKQKSVKTRRYVWNQRHAGLTGSICQPVTESTYNWKHRRPLLMQCLLLS